MKFKMIYDLKGSEEGFNYLKSNLNDQNFIKSAFESFEIEHHVKSSYLKEPSLYDSDTLNITLTYGIKREFYSSPKFILEMKCSYPSILEDENGLFSSQVTFKDSKDFAVRFIKVFLDKNQIPTLLIKKIVEDQEIKNLINKHDIRYINILGFDLTGTSQRAEHFLHLDVILKDENTNL